MPRLCRGKGGRLLKRSKINNKINNKINKIRPKINKINKTRSKINHIRTFLQIPPKINNNTNPLPLQHHLPVLKSHSFHHKVQQQQLQPLVTIYTTPITNTITTITNNPPSTHPTTTKIHHSITPTPIPSTNIRTNQHLVRTGQFSLQMAITIQLLIKMVITKIQPLTKMVITIITPTKIQPSIKTQPSTSITNKGQYSTRTPIPIPTPPPLSAPVENQPFLHVVRSN